MTTRIAAFCAPCASAARPRACSDTAAAPRTHHETAASRKPPATVTVAAAGALAPLANLFERAGRVRCPFWRRRATDALEAATMVLRWGAARHASLLPLPATAAAAPYGPALPISVRVARLRDDFERRQYYVTGRLSRELYHPQCVFDGPDPDTPVAGTAKWCNATGGLFYQRKSRVDLLRIEVLDDYCVCAHWRIEGVLALPWRPPIKPFLGSTIYTFNEQGLIFEHMETWSISAVDAFVSVVWPQFGSPPAPPVHMCSGWSGEDGETP